MIDFYKTIDGQISKIDGLEKNCWINVVNPSRDELLNLIKITGVDADFINAALDIEEISRIENEDELHEKLILFDIPMVEKENGNTIYSTLPLSFISTDEFVMTVCLRKSGIIDDFALGRIKNVNTALKTRFLLQILYRSATSFLQYLKQIDRMASSIEQELHVSMRNKELIQLLGMEKSLVYFSTSLKADMATIKKVSRGKYLKLYEDDEDLMDDVIVEIEQAIEMSEIYSNILSGTMDAFASIISNNLNIVMKFLAAITIVMAVPTIITSFYGMNVKDLPFASSWIVPAFIAIGTSLVTTFWLKKKDMF
ncbi:MAG: magnesium transporter CorA family protein [Bacillota bacterium]|nr:magnesium transporter CorA family protein [Bacillota bacterium]